MATLSGLGAAEHGHRQTPNSTPCATPRHSSGPGAARGSTPCSSPTLMLTGQRAWRAASSSVKRAEM